jgi:signal transduction histidine kinase
MSAISLTNSDWDIVLKELRHIPPDVQSAIIADHSQILISTIPELKALQIIDDKALFKFIKETSGKYFYQVVSPPLHDKTMQLLFLSRVYRDKRKLPPENKNALGGLILILIFEVLCITVIVNLSKTISRSITLLEKNTARIANGELNLKLLTQKGKQSNEITSLTENLDKMRNSLREDEERRTRFIMGISHDLRTPVAVIKGYTEALSDAVLDDPTEIHKALEIINTKTGQLENMIDTLINFVKLNNYEWRKKLIPQPIEPILQEFAKASKITGEIFKRIVTTSIAVSPDLLIPIDKMLFQRALENLFSNALRYTKEADRISISAAATDTALKIEIGDTGCGIAEKDQKHIFDLFYRGSNSRREEGMGIGLSVVKNIVDTHGWAIALESKQGHGSLFTITIPLDKTEIIKQN